MISLLGEDLERLEPLENFVTNHSLRWEENLTSKISAELQARVGTESKATNNNNNDNISPDASPTKANGLKHEEGTEPIQESANEE
jgi:hypothetical protein